MSHPSSYGVLAQFASSEALLDAARDLTRHPDYALEAYTPYPVDGLPELLGMVPDKVPQITFLAGVLGGVAGYFMQWYASVVSYPINAGGRPDNSWPLFIPVTFACVILFASLGAVIAMLAGNGLPRLRHPVFNAPEFGNATRNRYFLCVRAVADSLDTEQVKTRLQAHRPLTITEV